MAPFGFVYARFQGLQCAMKRTSGSLGRPIPRQVEVLSRLPLWLGEAGVWGWSMSGSCWRGLSRGKHPFLYHNTYVHITPSHSLSIDHSKGKIFGGMGIARIEA